MQLTFPLEALRRNRLPLPEVFWRKKTHLLMMRFLAAAASFWISHHHRYDRWYYYFSSTRWERSDHRCESALRYLRGDLQEHRAVLLRIAESGAARHFANSERGE